MFDGFQYKSTTESENNLRYCNDLHALFTRYEFLKHTTVHVKSKLTVAENKVLRLSAFDCPYFRTT